MPENSLPLWRVMSLAAPSGVIFGTPGAVQLRCAAQLGAIADYLTPLESEPKVRQSARHLDRDLEEWHYWLERQRLRTLLLSEAKQAAQGS